MEIVDSYDRKCRNNIAGVKAVWLLKWQKYSRSQIVTNGNILIDFPDTFIHRFDSLNIPEASERIQENEGGKFYEQSISMSFKATTSREFDQLIKNDYRLVFQDNNGLYRIFGLYNGMQCGAVDYATGSAKNELNGYRFTLTGQEEKESLFIEDLAAVGLTEEDFFLLSMNNDFLTTMQPIEKLIYR